MLDDLEGFHDNLTEFDVWAEDTAMVMDGIRRSAADMSDLDMTRTHFEVQTDLIFINPYFIY